jgi:uncharacterized protein YbjT (DUF2867 family)
VSTAGGPLRIVMLGASGAVGMQALTALLQGTEAVQVSSLGRRAVELPLSPRLTQHLIDIFDPSSYAPHLQGQQVAICTLGVGQPSAMSRAEFVQVDKDAVLDFAKACKAAGVRHFVLLSSVGVSAQSRSFYLRTKGELNEALAALCFERLSIFQPSMILTPTNRYGWSQALVLGVWPRLNGVLLGPLQCLRGIPVAELGRAMAVHALTQGTGEEVLQWADFKRLAATRC